MYLAKDGYAEFNYELVPDKPMFKTVVHKVTGDKTLTLANAAPLRVTLREPQAVEMFGMNVPGMSPGDYMPVIVARNGLVSTAERV